MSKSWKNSVLGSSLLGGGGESDTGVTWQRRRQKESGEGRPEGWGQLSIFLQAYLREQTDAGKHFVACLVQGKAQKIKVPNTLMVFLLEYSDCKNKTLLYLKKGLCQLCHKCVEQLWRYHFNWLHIQDFGFVNKLYKQIW